MSGTSPSQPTGAINVTPLVDVCLVLLVAFVVVTPLLGPTTLPGLQLPRTAHPVMLKGKALEITVRADGSLLVGAVPVAASSLAAEVRRRIDPALDRVVVRGDQRLRYTEVRRVMQVLKDVGFRGVGLLTEQQCARPV
jgi:biopolymer transport protein TolR